MKLRPNKIITPNVGAIPPPSFSHAFTNSIPSGFTFTRSTTSAMHRQANGYGATFAINTPAFGYNLAGQPLGYACFSGANNLETYSNDLTNAAHTKTNVTITPNAATFADGTVTMAKVVNAAVTGQHALTRSSSHTITANSYNCFSLFFKMGEETTARIEVFDGTFASGSFYATCNLATGTITGSGAVAGTGVPVLGQSGVEDWGGGLYRFFVSGKVDATSTTANPTVFIRDNSSYLGSTSNGLYAGGRQFEAGAVPTPYIATTTAAGVTTQESLTANFPINGVAFPTSGTLLFEYTNYWVANAGLGGALGLIYLANAGNTNFIRTIKQNTSLVSRSEVLNAGTQAQIDIATIASNTKEKLVVAWATNNTNAAFKGTLGTLDTACTIPTDISKMDVGGSFSGKGNIYVSRIALWNTRQSESNITSLST